MQVILEGQLLSMFQAPDYTDSQGEVTKGKHKLQLLVDTKLSNGSVKQEMQDISIPDNKVSEYEAQRGKKIQVKCNFMSKSNVNFYLN